MEISSFMTRYCKLYYILQFFTKLSKTFENKTNKTIDSFLKTFIQKETYNLVQLCCEFCMKFSCSRLVNKT